MNNELSKMHLFCLHVDDITHNTPIIGSFNTSSVHFKFDKDREPYSVMLTGLTKKDAC